MATASSQTLDLSETSSSIIESNAQTPFYSPTRAHSADQLTLVVNTSSKHTKVLGLRSLFVEKVRGVKEFGQRFNKLGRHLSASDQSELAASPRLLSVSSIDPESDVPRLVRTNAIKVGPVALTTEFNNLYNCVYFLSSYRLSIEIQSTNRLQPVL